MSDVFLSYSHTDKIRAEQLFGIIEQRRSVFMDRRRLSPGAKWESELRQELHSARCIVVLWSEASIDSEWVRREAHEGQLRDVLVPARIDDVKVPLEFAEFQASDLVGWPDADKIQLQNLLVRIDEVVRLPRGTPDAIANEWTNLVAKLDDTVPRKIEGENLLVASWNVRNLGSLTQSWESSAHDSPKRDKRAAVAIAEIISRFDIVMVTEVTGSADALHQVVSELLGESWAVLFPDYWTFGGTMERVAFVYDSRRILTAGLAGRIQLEEYLDEFRPPLATPLCAASFRTRSAEIPVHLTLAVLHFDYYARGADPDGQAFLAWMEDWANALKRESHALIVLGDFNIDRVGNPLYDIVARHGLFVPLPLQGAPRSIFGASPESSDGFYDQIAWFGGSPEGPTSNVRISTSGFFDFVQVLKRGLPLASLSFRISDHYPLWCEFSTRQQQ